jgi:hypothetical protein
MNLTDSTVILYTAHYITGAHHADSLSLDGAVRQLARMLELDYTELRADQVMYDGRPLNSWYVYAPGECVGTVSITALN